MRNNGVLLFPPFVLFMLLPLLFVKAFILFIKRLPRVSVYAGLNPSIKFVPYGESILFVRAVGEL